jgi:hypothetical protein
VDERQHIAAKTLAQGGTEREAAAAAGCSLASITRWKRRADFKELMLQYSSPLRVAIAQGAAPSNLFALIPERESKLLEKLEKMAATLGEILERRLGDLSEDDLITEIPTRLLPSFMKAYIDAYESIANALDRLSGYELILSEVSKINEKSEQTSKNTMPRNFDGNSK